MLYINIDLETTGARPDTHAIISIGAVALRNLEKVGEFSHNLRVPEGRVWDPLTLKWWEEQDPAVFAAAKENPSDPWWVMYSFSSWIEHIAIDNNEKSVAFVANPTSFDLPLLHSYMDQYVPNKWNELMYTYAGKGLGGVDLRTLAMAVLGVDHPYAGRSKWPARWTPADLPYTHRAIDDARLQAYAFRCMMQELAELRK